MTRTILRWLAVLGIAGLALLPLTAIHAQGSTGRDDTTISRGVQGSNPADSSTSDKNEHNPALAYAFVGFSTLIILVVVCMPSRKG